MSANAAGVEGRVLVVRVEGADRAAEELHLPSARDRPRDHPDAARHHVQEHSRRHGPGTGTSGILCFIAPRCPPPPRPYSSVRVLLLWLTFNRGEFDVH